MEFRQEHSNDVSAVCHSYHLTSFAVLVSAKHEPEQVNKISVASGYMDFFIVVNRSGNIDDHIIHWMLYINSLPINFNCCTKHNHIQVSFSGNCITTSTVSY